MHGTYIKITGINLEAQFMDMSRDTENITANFHAFIPRHSTNALWLPAEGHMRLQKYKESKTWPVQATKEHRRSGVTITLIAELGATWEVGSQLHAPATLSARKNSVIRWIGSGVSSRDGLNDLERIEVFFYDWLDSKPGSSSTKYLSRVFHKYRYIFKF